MLEESMPMLVIDDLLRSVLDKISDGAYIVSPQREILYWNKSAEEITGYSKEEVINTHCYDNILRHIDENGTELCKEKCPVVYAIENNRPVEARVFLHHKEGYRLPVSVRVIPVTDKNNTVIWAIELFSEIVDYRTLKRELEELRSLAFIDELTGVLNRRGLEYFISEKTVEAKRFGKRFGILFLDLDNFKDINDLYGHKVGDKVLKMVAGVLKNNLRSNDVVARYGGDEFVVIAEILKEEDLEVLANKIMTLIDSSFIEEDKGIIKVSVSIGGAISEEENLKKSLEIADSLMYISKSKGKNRFTL
jgi:diguanylate cyclase (GGDEF)-like protein/PAS domain S-box-containing protein